MKLYILPIITVFFLSIINTGCAGRETSTVILQTNRPELAAYVEEFNTTHNSTKVIIKYKAHPGTGSVSGTKEVFPDLVFGEHLNSFSFISNYTPVESLLEDGLIKRDLFYKNLLKTGLYQEHQVLLPVSFNLPAIIFKKGEESSYIKPFFINLEDLKKASLEASEKSRKKFAIEGFSMLWDKEIPFQISRLFGTSYNQVNSILSWNDAKLNKAVSYMRDWSATVNGGLAKEKDFIEKYIYDPKPKLIENGRIRFSYETLDSFFSIPTEKRTNLEFRWLSYDNKVNVLHNILFAGIPKTASNKKGAKKFLSWFFKIDTQRKLLKGTIHKRIRTFGIAQGFSSLHLINTEELPKIYPALMGHIPPETSLTFPSSVPKNWLVIKEQIIKPWLFSTISSKTMTSESLKDAVHEWEKQNPLQSTFFN